MQARMPNPASVLPDAVQPIQALIKAAHKGGVPQSTMELVHLRVSQINGCSACVASGAVTAKEAGRPTSGSSPRPHGGRRPTSRTLSAPP